jgi:hypothetical protein
LNLYVPTGNVASGDILGLGFVPGVPLSEAFAGLSCQLLAINGKVIPYLELSLFLLSNPKISPIASPTIMQIRITVKITTLHQPPRSAKNLLFLISLAISFLKVESFSPFGPVTPSGSNPLYGGGLRS